MQILGRALRTRGAAEDDALLLPQDVEPVANVGRISAPTSRVIPRSAQRNTEPNAATNSSLRIPAYTPQTWNFTGFARGGDNCLWFSAAR
jgi:hypothetical protein